MRAAKNTLTAFGMQFEPPASIASLIQTCSRPSSQTLSSVPMIVYITFQARISPEPFIGRLDSRDLTERPY